MLESLFITSDLPELPSFFLPVSTFAPRLTHLEINTSFGALSTILQGILQSVAPQLTRLGLTFTLVRSPERRDEILSSLQPFLIACTSIIALRLHDPFPSELHHVLSLLPSRLILLDVSPLLLDDEDAEGMPKGLAEAFDLPCMAQLRRWRITREFLFSAPDPALEALAEEQWRAACRARGIEPRGAERYFTD
ncbi:hypothetical protein BCR35DRAFT_121718 [Leucosporidium creatinivorum]|uniref:Uncharacterized protein n=1 Tax=Leucosporidium creatinivorum TaxID=106004 RepID=A0A1Y2EXD2_9BASI|nr:hypothetical protein BCR35DRAFT_121718 [Leucosporidium creatinivorum]